ncbi:hypothetical protein LUZ60_010671 [Juncus effusus]|nr:hypothetical protein LUZ60_010671 [Juncus effusus]
MGLRINGVFIYLVVGLIILNFLSSNLDALEATNEVKVSRLLLKRRKLATAPFFPPANSPLPAGTFPEPSRTLSPPAPDPLSPPNKEKKDTNNNKNNNKNNSVVPAVILTVLGAILVACIFLCCYKCKKSRKVKRDERPLLHMSLTDFSASSQTSHASSPIDISKLSALPLPPKITKTPSLQPATPKAAPPPPPPPPKKPVPPPPPPPLKKPPGPPPPPPPAGKKPGLPPPPGQQTGSSKGKSSADVDAGGEEKKKLKPFFWDKVMMGNGNNTDQSMVWDHIKSGSFQFSEEMIESLFGVSSDKGKNEKKELGLNEKITPQYIKLLDPKKSQNLAISLKAKNVKVEHVIEAVNEGNELPKELIETVLKMRPTQDEELKLRMFNGDNNLLGPAEQFYKVLIEIPFVFERLNALVFMSTFHEECSVVRRDFTTLEVACGELKSSRLFLKLLEAVLKLGNRMNSGTFRGGAHAFKLDTLLKLSDVKGTDGKTTLLHFVVQQIVRSEGLRARQNPNPNSNPNPNFEGRRASRLPNPNRSPNFEGLGSSHQNPNPNSKANPNFEEEGENDYFALGLDVVSSLGEELLNVKRAAGLDIDSITNNVASLGNKLVEIRKFYERFVKSIEGESGFRNILECFVQNATGEAEFLIENEKKVRVLVKNTVDYFHGNNGKDEGLRIFVIVRDFLGVLDRVCREVRVRGALKPVQRKRELKSRSGSGSGIGIPDPRQYLFPAIRDRRVDSSSSSSSDED